MSKRKILLADDSATIQKVVNLTFAGEDIEVVTVGDGDAAMRKFVEVAPDLVLADVNMPGLNGYEVCERIKQSDEPKSVPVILLVGSFEPFDEEKARRVGADDFLTKPFQSIRQLVDKVSDLLEAKTDADDFLLPVEKETAAADSYADTLEMPPGDELEATVSETENLGDAGMDDEMIQTSQIGSLPTDEAHKFESAPVYQSFAEELDQSAPKPPDSEIVADYPPAENWAQTQPLSKADLEEIRGVSGNRKTAPDLDFDEFDLLEFPQTAREEIPVARVLPAKSEIFDRALSESREAADEIPESSGETSKSSTESENLSPESIEAIAEKVAEKLSSQVIERVVREVIAQMEQRK